jgi:hypothetical protein
MASSPTRPVTLDLAWQGGMRFTGTSGAASIALSREKYCSVWLSLRQDIELTATFDIVAG